MASRSAVFAAAVAALAVAPVHGASSCVAFDSWSVAAGKTGYCCSTEPVTGWSYTVTGGSNDDNMHWYIVEYESTSTYFTESECTVKNDGTTCEGAACDFADLNDCTSIGIGATASKKLCLEMVCDDILDDCKADSVSVTFTGADDYPDPAPKPSPSPMPSPSPSPMPSPSPSPMPSPSPSPSPAPAPAPETSQNCKCMCCVGNFCDAALVASYNVVSSSECQPDKCSAEFPSVCPVNDSNEGQAAGTTESYYVPSPSAGDNAPSPDDSSKAPSSGGSGPPVAIIAGAAAGGLALIAGIVGIVIYTRGRHAESVCAGPHTAVNIAPPVLSPKLAKAQPSANPLYG